MKSLKDDSTVGYWERLTVVFVPLCPNFAGGEAQFRISEYIIKIKP